MIKLIKDQWPLLGFGFLFTFASAFGQSFFIGEFAPALKQTFGLSDGGLGSLYFFGTLASSLVLIYTGGLIDRMPLSRYALLVLSGLLVGVLLIASAPHWLLLIPAFFVLRQCGQGLSLHIYASTMARYFHARRGRALALGGLGLTLAESSFPWIMIFALTALGWRGTWVAAGGVILVLMALSQLLLRRSQRVQKGDTRGAAAAEAGQGFDDPVEAPSQTRAQAVRGLFFYAQFYITACFGFIVTASFFFRKALGEAKGWEPETLAQGLSAYAMMSLLGYMLAGPTVDRFGSIRTAWLPFCSFIPSLLVLALGKSDASFWLAFGLMGLAQGLLSTIANAVWPEAYGTRHIGAIRALASGMAIFSTAAAPMVFGAAMDWGISIETIFLACQLWAVTAAAVSLTLPWLRPRL
jgi:MFS family permease